MKAHIQGENVRMDDTRAWHDCHLCILCGPEIFASPVAKLLHVANM